MLAQWLERSGQIYGDHIAIAHGERAIMTYSDLSERVARFAGNLRQVQGFQRGARIAIFATNCPEYLEILFGIWHAGMVAVPINNKLHPNEVLDILNDSDASLCFVTADLASKWARPSSMDCAMSVIGGDDYQDYFTGSPALICDAEQDDMAWLFYTSGTTGKPKGAMLSYRNLVAMSLGYHSDVDKVRPGDSIIHAAPMSHGSGIYAIPQVAMGSVNVIPESGRFEPEEIERLYKVWPRASMFAAPTMVKRMVEGGLDPEGLKNIIYGGGPMYVADAKKARKAFPNRLTQIYGQGESPMTITVLPTFVIEDTKHLSYESRIGSVGFANMAVEIKIANEKGQALLPDQTGEILVKGDAVMLGYWKNAEATADAIRNDWLHTGDLGAMDEDGFVTLMDRSKDVIISGGSNIYPREVEEILLSHREVTEVSVIARPDEEWGEVLLPLSLGKPVMMN